jgi:ribosomal protein S16
MRKRYNEKVIAFRRRGCKGYSVFDIVVKNTYGKGYREKIGHFNPQISERVFFIDGARLGTLLNGGVKVHSNIKKYIAKMVGGYEKD